MNVEDIVDEILTRKEALNMTCQQIADCSGVPRSTVHRILQKQTPNPSSHSLNAIAAAVGLDVSGSPDPSMPPQELPQDAKTAMLESMVNLCEKRNQELRASYNRIISAKDRLIWLSLAANVVLVGILLLR